MTNQRRTPEPEMSGEFERQERINKNVEKLNQLIKFAKAGNWTIDLSERLSADKIAVILNYPKLLTLSEQESLSIILDDLLQMKSEFKNKAKTRFDKQINKFIKIDVHRYLLILNFKIAFTRESNWQILDGLKSQIDFEIKKLLSVSAIKITTNSY